MEIRGVSMPWDTFAIPGDQNTLLCADAQRKRENSEKGWHILVDGQQVSEKLLYFFSFSYLSVTISFAIKKSWCTATKGFLSMFELLTCRRRRRRKRERADAFSLENK